MRPLAEEHYPEAEKVRVLLDNLNTHTPASLYMALEPQEGRRLLRRLEFHHTPKHASWLNQVEIELSAVPQSPHPGREYAIEGERSMGERAEGTGGDAYVAFHRLRRSGEAEAALPTTIIMAEY